MSGLAPNTSRLVLERCESDDDPPPIFSGPSTITELVLNGNGFCVGRDADPADLSLFWTPLIPTVTSITFELCNLHTSILRLHRLRNVSQIGFLPYNPPEYQDPENLSVQVSFMIRKYPNLRHFVLPIDSSWDRVESVFSQIAGPEIQVSRHENPGELTYDFTGIGPAHSFHEEYNSGCEDSDGD